MTGEFEAAAIHQENPHDQLDVEAALANATLVIPTDRDENYTRKTAPDWLDIEIATQDGLNVARNRGIEAADGEWILLVDDDVTFPTRLTAALVDSMHSGHLVGLEDFWPLRWTIGRFMLFHRDLWQQVGGFDESRPHGGDTDFAIRCEKAGARVIRLPRRLVPHHDVRSAFSAGEHLEWLAYLFQRHPRKVAVPAAKLALRKVGLIRQRESEYPDDWQSQVWVPPEAVDNEADDR